MDGGRTLAQQPLKMLESRSAINGASCSSSMVRLYSSGMEFENASQVLAKDGISKQTRAPLVF